MGTQHLVIRADASSEVGMGHISRQCDLAHALSNIGWQTTIVVRAPEFVRSFITARCPAAVTMLDEDPHTDEKRLSALLMSLAPDAVMVDLLNQDTDADYMRLFRQLHVPIVSITDDPYPRRVDCDIQICCNPNQTPALYSDHPSDTVTRFLGVSYVIAHPIFAQTRSQRTYPDQAMSLLILFGGVRHAEAMEKVSAALRLLKEPITVRCIASTLAGKESVRHAFDGTTIEIEVRTGLSPERVCEEMIQADMMVGSCGNAAYEASIVGLPVITVNQVIRQNENATVLESKGACLNLGMVDDVQPQLLAQTISSLMHTKNKREEMGKQAKALFDGKGVSRVVDIITTAVHS